MAKSKPNLDQKSCLYANANLLSQISIWWMNSLFKKGYEQKLSSADMCPIADYDSADYLTNQLEKHWENEQEQAQRNHRKPSFSKAFIRCYIWRFILYGIFQVLWEIFRCLSPLLIGELSVYFSNPDTVPVWYAYTCAAGIAIASVLSTTTSQIFSLKLFVLGWNARTAVVGLMYKKTLRLSNEALSQTTTGKIVNLSSTDAIRYDFAFYFTHYIWLAPLESIIVTYILWRRLGPAAVVGMSLLFIIMSIQAGLGKLFGKLRIKAAALTDQRVDVMSEIISGMRIIKMYSWEKSFMEIVTKLRNGEMRKILLASLLRSFNYTATHSTSQVLAYATFMVSTAMQGTITLQSVDDILCLTGQDPYDVKLMCSHAELTNFLDTPFVENHSREPLYNVVLVAVGLFTIMRIGVGVFFPLSVEKFSEARIALQRTERFLLLPEVEPSPDDRSDKTSPCFVQFDDVTSTWSRDGKTTLRNVSFEVAKGKLLVVIGPVGSGKSSLLSAILNELPAESGKVKVHGKIAYSSQIAWLLPESIRDNILFDEVYDPVRYQKVVKACALERDFEILPHGDATIVGERGVTLSGGQKARVGLARSVYCSNTDIALFDDPLSAVDPSVANHLFDECICGIAKDKVRILVTHQLQFLGKADQILILKEGTVADCGTFDELQAKGTDFTSLVKTDDETKDCGAINATSNMSTAFCASREHLTSIGSYASDDVTIVPDALLEDKVTNEDIPPGDDVETALLENNEVAVKFSGSHTSLPPSSDLDQAGKETSGKATIGVAGYYQYFKAGVKMWYLVVFLIIMLGNHVLLMLADWWLAHWAFDSENYHRRLATFIAQQNILSNQTMTQQPLRFNETVTQQNIVYNESTTSINETTSSLNPPSFDTSYYILLYSLFTFGFLVSMYTRTAMNFYLCIRSSIQLHAGMLAAILKAKIRFFDVNPVGGVLNRFSKDMNQIDELLPNSFIDVLFLCGSMLAILFYVIIVNYFIIIVVIPMAIYFIWIRRYYVTTSREIKSIEGSNRSPVFGQLSSTLQGLVMIRTFRAQDSFIKKYNRLQDLHGVAWASYLHGSRWFAYRLDMMTAIFVAFCAFFGVILTSLLPNNSTINAANLGLTLTYSITLLGAFQWSVRQTAEVENLMTSVGRIREYHKIPPESEDGRKTEKVPADWPENGSISFNNVSYAYSSGGPLVLRNITLDIKPREKLGIVGRTGAGKSSMIASIFLMSDHVTGSITIDGIDTSQIDLQDLRSSLAIIPQDPVLFGGTMRRNLDAFSSYSDEQIWSALEQVQLKPLVESLPLKLESKLSESGSNLSVGQRQLVCLARAILRNNKILVIDEATANVDLRTDQLIQETIRARFSMCTVITIAHRLNTIISSDRILVLENGEVLECDQPHVLLQNPDGVFTGMVGATGEQEEELRKAAKKAHDS